MIQFNYIAIVGFGSIRDYQVFYFNRPGISIIRGKVGSGKTTIFNALYWGIYGKNLKGVPQEKLPTKEKYRTD